MSFQLPCICNLKSLSVLSEWNPVNICGGGDEWASGNSGNFRATSLIKDIKPKILVRPYRVCVLWSNRHGSVHCAWVNVKASLECVWRQLGGAWAGENSDKY